MHILQCRVLNQTYKVELDKRSVNKGDTQSTTRSIWLVSEFIEHIKVTLRTQNDTFVHMHAWYYLIPSCLVGLTKILTSNRVSTLEMEQNYWLEIGSQHWWKWSLIIYSSTLDFDTICWVLTLSLPFFEPIITKTTFQSDKKRYETI